MTLPDGDDTPEALAGSSGSAELPVPSSRPPWDDDEAPRSSPCRAGFAVGGRYRLQSLLGSGSMGEVWRAQDLLLGSEVAIKVLLPVAMDQFPRARERFRQEAQIAFRLGKMTPYVVTAYDAGDDPDAGSYLVMEHVRGMTLRDEMIHRGPLPVDVVAELLDQVAEALKVAHGRGILHRDLKPSNLLLVDREDGRLHVKVADFGLAKAAPGVTHLDRPRSTCEGTILGTLSYMSPEQAQALPVDHRTDLWALGVIAYEALLGQTPFRASSWGQVLKQLLLERPAPLSTARPDLPASLDAWLARALAKDPAERFDSGEEMALEFRRALAGKKLLPKLPLPKDVAPRVRGGGARGIIAGVVAIAAATLATTLPWLPEPQPAVAAGIAPPEGEAAGTRQAPAGEDGTREVDDTLAAGATHEAGEPRRAPREGASQAALEGNHSPVLMEGGRADHPHTPDVGTQRAVGPGVVSGVGTLPGPPVMPGATSSPPGRPARASRSEVF
ncbi:Serine/threonine protein kinase [Chondromyces apiculatus DSM 436]|uniref:Serine/threonine protein kinase n=2 Tax=Chondromyces apiculatus TaxID=51 RepID=A0A017SVX8_9BACT|nr:Serine/threonine protein kinase [Chondromyces apiculatus DSM 436]